MFFFSFEYSVAVCIQHVLYTVSNGKRVDRALAIATLVYPTIISFRLHQWSQINKQQGNQQSEHVRRVLCSKTLKSCVDRVESHKSKKKEWNTLSKKKRKEKKKEKRRYQIGYNLSDMHSTGAKRMSLLASWLRLFAFASFLNGPYFS